MDLITTFQKKRQKQAENGNEPSDGNSVERTVDIQEPTEAIPIDAKQRRLVFQDDYAEIFQEVLRCEYLCRQRNLRYDRVRYLGDYDLRKRKEFLLDYLYSLCDLLEYRGGKGNERNSTIINR